MKERKQPPVVDIDGRHYIKNDRGGWVPVDNPGALPMTFGALLQNVPDGELHVDHTKGDD